ncbi:ABC-type Fe3+/spermidine/putrescine transport systems, ATPase components [Gillisia sp. Hel1_33_143]|uniref:ABC transporter ATP-binding protein n=1 Tax=Gillisia sp. Hel1_33_143 TaxID=1336796 RepID=UPI00087C94DC|nr:ABC transporter ATP-binding protein [Gillisia sp. Hel1_33_143]SDR88082.1 ABC-type Fe3+/spermidine/putrescine transport systems, ATPase components [Gillisia sp. Hel1_33_143]
MLQLKNVSFSYDKTPILKNINLKIEKGQNVSIIGASGCGKSTLLQLIYGLHHTDGIITWNGKELLGPTFNLVPGEDFIKYLAQDFDLMPPLSVQENVGKYLSNMYPVKKKRRIKELLGVVEMQDMANVKASKLSGGQQQRVALARALANEPELILLDEPFSHIDHFRKNNLRRRLFAYLKEKNITCIIATHDSTDALSFADETIVLKNTKIHAKDAPFNLYQHPKDKYVASLFGDVNEIHLNQFSPDANSKKKILLYPDEIKISKSSKLKVKVLKSYFKGNAYLIKAALSGQTIFFENASALEINEIVGIKVSEAIITKRS